MVKSTKPVLYLMIGYPGAGKTTISKKIAAATGAFHLWADVERHKLYPEPTHSLEESAELYKRLNQAAGYLLGQGKSVVYDTNFNFYADRQLMHGIAMKHKADTVVVWVTTPLEVARDHAVGSERIRNGYAMTMTGKQFDAITSKLQPPRENEKVIKIDSTRIDDKALLALLKT